MIFLVIFKNYNKRRSKLLVYSIYLIIKEFWYLIIDNNRVSLQILNYKAVIALDIILQIVLLDNLLLD